MNISVNEREFELIMRGLDMLLSHLVYKTDGYCEVERLYDSLEDQKEEWEVSTYTPDFDPKLQQKH